MAPEGGRHALVAPPSGNEALRERAGKPAVPRRAERADGPHVSGSHGGTPAMVPGPIRVLMLLYRMACFKDVQPDAAVSAVTPTSSASEAHRSKPAPSAFPDRRSTAAGSHPG